MKLFKLIIKIVTCWALISLTIQFADMFFTEDGIAYKVLGGSFSLIFIVFLIIIVRTFFPAKRRTRTAQYNGAYRIPTDQAAWVRYHAERQKRTNFALLGLFVFIISINALARTIRNIM
jgi:hypothetical protein